jgi:hypothetical protein
MRLSVTCIHFLTAIVGSLNTLPVLADDVNAIDEDMTARRRKLALKDSGPASEKEVAALERLLSRQVFRIEENDASKINKENRRTTANVHTNPLSRALKKSRSAAGSKQGRRRRTAGGRSGAFGGRSEGGGFFNMDAAGETSKMTPTLVEETASVDASLPEASPEVADTTRLGGPRPTGSGTQEDVVDTTRTYYDDRKSWPRSSYPWLKPPHYLILFIDVRCF